jgi:hypothetical protein
MTVSSLPGGAHKISSRQLCEIEKMHTAANLW